MKQSRAIEKRKENENAPYSDEAKAFVEKIYVCQPPCDSYGVCAECASEIDFGAGYNFGYDYVYSTLEAANARIKELEDYLIEKQETQNDLCEFVNKLKEQNQSAMHLIEGLELKFKEINDRSRVPYQEATDALTQIKSWKEQVGK